LCLPLLSAKPVSGLCLFSEQFLESLFLITLVIILPAHSIPEHLTFIIHHLTELQTVKCNYMYYKYYIGEANAMNRIGSEYYNEYKWSMKQVSELFCPYASIAPIRLCKNLEDRVVNTGDTVCKLLKGSFAAFQPAFYHFTVGSSMYK